MKEIKLISMTDFVIQNENMVKTTEIEMSKDLYNLAQYAHFLKQPLKLGMFVPCDEDDNVLEEPVYSEPTSENEIGNLDELIYQFNLAKDRVLFDGFTVENGIIFLSNKQILIQKSLLEKMKIEDIISANLILTQSSIKQLEL